MKKLLAVLASMALAAPAWPQSTVPSRTDRALFAGYNLTATSLTYCALSNPPQQGPARLTTSGSSTTVTRADTSSEPFTGLVVGDEINPMGQTQPPGKIGGNPLTRYITTITNTHSVVVGTAVDLSGGPGGSYAWQYRSYGDKNGNTLCGTTNSLGWVASPPGSNTITITVSSQSGVTTFTYSIEGLSRGGGPYEGATQLLTGTMTVFTATISGGPANSISIPIGEDLGFLRVGVKVDAGSARVDVVLSNQGWGQ